MTHALRNRIVLIRLSAIHVHIASGQLLHLPLLLWRVCMSLAFIMIYLFVSTPSRAPACVLVGVIEEERASQETFVISHPVSKVGFQDMKLQAVF